MRERFDAELLQLLEALEYRVITAVMDKQAQLAYYKAAEYHPYYYCLSVLLERYVMCLQGMGHRGDVMAESRGGREDRQLKAEFERLYTEGSGSIDSRTLARWLTSKQLKVKPKSNNIAGLQIADLIAHPSFKAIQARRNEEPLARNFGGKISAILEESKYYRDQSGRIEGCGWQWLP